VHSVLLLISLSVGALSEDGFKSISRKILRKLLTAHIALSGMGFLLSLSLSTLAMANKWPQFKLSQYVHRAGHRVEAPRQKLL
jgi:hypothetical protein